MPRNSPTNISGSSTGTSISGSSIRCCPQLLKYCPTQAERKEQWLKMTLSWQDSAKWVDLYSNCFAKNITSLESISIQLSPMANAPFFISATHSVNTLSTQPCATLNRIGRNSLSLTVQSSRVPHDPSTLAQACP